MLDIDVTSRYFDNILVMLCRKNFILYHVKLETFLQYFSDVSNIAF